MRIQRPTCASEAAFQPHGPRPRQRWAFVGIGKPTYRKIMRPYPIDQLNMVAPKMGKRNYWVVYSERMSKSCLSEALT